MKNCISYLLLIFLILTGCAVNPVTGKQELALISESQELAIGKENYPVTTQINNGIFQDDTLQAYVNTVGKRLAAVSHRPNLPYEFNVVNSSDLNAYALPGGKISLTRGLLNRFETEDQLAGVLGHEIGHVTARHSVAQISRQTLTQIAMAGAGTFLGVMDVKNRDLYALGSTFGAKLLLLKYSRNQESQSDMLGLEYMTKAGYNPTGHLQAMEIIKEAQKREPSKIESLFQTHPNTSERVKAIESELNTSYASFIDRPFIISTFEEKTRELKDLEEAYRHYDKGDEFISKKDFKGAEEEYKKAISYNNRQAVFYVGLAWALMKQGKQSEARASISTSITLYPELFSGRFLGGVISYDMNDYNQAIVDLDEADRLIPSVPNVKLYKARCFEGLGKIPEAISSYKEVISLATKSKAAEEARRKLLKWGTIKESPPPEQF